MAAYYILRPLRDGLASDWSDAEVSFLWTINFFASSLAVAIYGWVVARVRLRHLVPMVYGFFSVSFLLFYVGMWNGAIHPLWVDKSFYVWVSLFSLFNVSVFWSFVADLYTKSQAKRLFPIIGAGASAGALLGPIVPTLLIDWTGTYNLLLISAVLLLLGLPLSISLQRLQEKNLNSSHSSSKQDYVIGGNPFSGFRDFIKNGYLLNIGLFIVLYTAVASFVYFQQKNLLEPYDLEQRTRFLGAVDWIVNALTFFIAFFATGRIVHYFGMPVALSSIPWAMSGGLLLLAATPVVWAVLLLQVIRRAGNYAITRPSREMLFTSVTREERFKAKPVIDIVAYRGGDMVTSWGFAAFTEGFGWTLSSLAVIGALLAAIWGLVGLFLGGRFNHQQERS